MNTNSTPNQSIYRVLDANLNRAREGLRVMEEVARFITETKKYAKQLKAARAKLHKAAQALPRPEMIVLARNAAGDIGKEINPKIEFKRSSIAGLFQANAKRVQEALRVLEEFTKLLVNQSDKIGTGKIKTAATFKKIRFEVYNIEKYFIANILI